MVHVFRQLWIVVVDFVVAFDLRVKAVHQSMLPQEIIVIHKFVTFTYTTTMIRLRDRWCVFEISNAYFTATFCLCRQPTSWKLLQLISPRLASYVTIYLLSMHKLFQRRTQVRVRPLMPVELQSPRWVSICVCWSRCYCVSGIAVNVLAGQADCRKLGHSVVHSILF